MTQPVKSLETTSIPRWPGVPPRVDDRGTSFAIVTIGAAAQPVGDRWERELAGRAVPFWRRHDDTFSDLSCQELRKQLAEALVGWRLLVSGPQHAVGVLLATATAAGALGSELAGHVTDDTAKRVRCAHCAKIAVVSAGIGDTVECPGCTRSLVVYYHFSRLHAAYLGYQSDAESDLVR